MSVAAPLPENNKLSGAGLPWPLHPACAAWPEMPPADLKALADDIFANGQRDPITLTVDNLLLDGRNRALACLMAGVEPKTEVFDGEPVLFVLSRNKHRRHMNQDHIALIVAELVKTKPLGANQHEGGPIGLPSIAKAAAEAGITETALKSAKLLHKYGTPEEVQAVKSGTVPLYKKADDARNRRRALAPPAPPKPTPKPAEPASPAVDPINAVACDIIAKCDDGKWRSAAKFGTVVKVAESAARQALKSLGEDCVAQRKNGSEIEYRIERGDEAEMRRTVAAKDVEIAARDREIVSLKNQIAEKDAEIERLTELLTAAPPRPTPSPKKANVSKH
jgi:hypothetical protein